MSTNLRRLGGTLSASAGLLLVTAGTALAAPNPHAQLPPGLENKTNVILGVFMAIVIVACVAGVLVCAAKLALSIRRGEGSEAVGALAGVAAACVLVGSAAGIVNYLV